MRQPSFFLGLVLFGTAYALGLWLGKRKFVRMSSGGVEQFKSYGAMLWARFLEVVARVIASILAIIGAFLLLDGLSPWLHSILDF